MRRMAEAGWWEYLLPHQTWFVDVVAFHLRVLQRDRPLGGQLCPLCDLAHFFKVLIWVRGLASKETRKNILNTKFKVICFPLLKC